MLLLWQVFSLLLSGKGPWYAALEGVSFTQIWFYCLSTTNDINWVLSIAFNGFWGPFHKTVYSEQRKSQAKVSPYSTKSAAFRLSWVIPLCHIRMQMQAIHDVLSLPILTPSAHPETLLLPGLCCGSSGSRHGLASVLTQEWSLAQRDPEKCGLISELPLEN